MTTRPPPAVRGAITLVVTTLGFAVALALRARVDPWQSTAVAAIVGIALAVWTLGARLRPLFAIPPRAAVGAIGLGLGLVVATHLAFRGVVAASPSLAAAVRALYVSVAVETSPILLFLLTTIVVIGEELVWRGVAIEQFAAGRSRFAVAAISVALYVLPQLAGGVPLLILAATGLGGLFAAQRLRTGRLADALLTHAVWSLSVFVVVPLA
ncbi:MAG: type II CAAX endopeptidase family protein [Proteobacteria bacterium]|nr:type II CAAX endopeptidase family protein [Pseudomonadota bacterium]